MATIWFFNKNAGEDVRLVDEVQFQNLIGMYKSKMHCQVILVVLDKALWDEDEFDHLETL